MRLQNSSKSSILRRRPRNNSRIDPYHSSSQALLLRILSLLGVITLVANVYFLWPSSNNNNEGRIRTRRRRDSHDTQHISNVIQNANLHPAEESRHQEHDDTSTVVGIDFSGRPMYRQVNTTTTTTTKVSIESIFKEAGVELDESALSELPTWEEIVDLVGEKPRIHGLDQCEAFRDSIPPTERNLGAAGMFNSGTNLVTQLLKNNCKIPERVELFGMNATREAHGIRWQVPWGKHTPGHYKLEHATEKARSIDKESVLPIVTIRNPYEWMKSMCRNGYTARWPHSKDHCPHISDGDNDELVPLHVSYSGRQENHSSLLHLWNDWYNDYYREAHYPVLMVRFEDLIFHSKEMTRLICECAGGELYSPDAQFQYIVDSAKDGPGHGKVSERTGMVDAWIHYGKRPEVRAGFNEVDYKTAKELLDRELMETFGYSHPPDKERR